MIKRILLVPITSDKGLCGGVNSQIVREVKHKIHKNRDMYKVIKLKRFLWLVAKESQDLLEQIVLL